MAGMNPTGRGTSVEDSNDWISAQGMSSFSPEYSKVSDVSEVVSNRPTTPARKAGAVPPAYITWSSSTAAIGRARVKSKQRVINFFMPYFLRFQHLHFE